MIRWIAHGFLLGCTLAATQEATAAGGDALSYARDAAQSALRARFPQIERLELRLVGERRQWIEAAELIGVDIAGPSIPKRIATRFRESRGSRERTLWWQVRALRGVASTRAALRPGDRLEPGGLAEVQSDVAGQDALAIAEIAPGQRLRRYLPAGSLIRASDLEWVPEVQRKQRVKVSVRAGPVQLETAGIAQADARLGQSVAVINPSSSQRYQARVTGRGEVTVGGHP